jgi:hypothetical protein
MANRRDDYMNRRSWLIDTAETQIICDSSNNTDNSSTLNVEVVVKPILTTDSFVISVTYTQ